jgi:hypothetical protein
MTILRKSHKSCESSGQTLGLANVARMQHTGHVSAWLPIIAGGLIKMRATLEPSGYEGMPSGCGLRKNLATRSTSSMAGGNGGAPCCQDVSDKWVEAVSVLAADGAALHCIQNLFRPVIVYPPLEVDPIIRPPSGRVFVFSQKQL